MTNPKRQRTAAPDPFPVKCELCRSFDGNAMFYRFGCTKGHAAGEPLTFQRKKCADYDPMTRDEQILKRFSFGAEANHREAGQLKNCQTAARRTAGSLASMVETFGKYLASEEIDAIKHTAEVMRRLGDDIEHAAKTAKRQADEHQARFESALKDAVKLVGSHPALNPATVADQLFLAYTLWAGGADYLRKAINDACEPRPDPKSYAGRRWHGVAWELRSYGEDLRRDLANSIASDVASRRGTVPELLGQTVEKLMTKRPAFDKACASWTAKVVEAAAAQAFVAEVAKPAIH